MGDSVQQFYDELAGEYDLMFADWKQEVRRQSEVLGEFIRRHLDEGARSVLDCACGIGTQAIALATRGYSVHATDFSASSVERARREAASFGVSMTFGVADWLALDAEVEDVFDVVICLEVLSTDRDGAKSVAPTEGQMKISIVIFDQFTDIDLFLMWDLFNRVRLPEWEVCILGDQPQHVSVTGMVIPTHGRIEEANEADAVLFISGQGTRTKMKDREWLARFQLNPEKQMIGSICSGALLLAALGLLKGKTATTYPTTKQTLESFGVTVVEMPFVQHGNIATAGGCLAAQYLVGWVIESKANAEWKELVLKSIRPVGEGLSFSDAEQLAKLYAPLPAMTAV